MCSAVRLRADEPMSSTALVAWLERWGGVWWVGVECWLYNSGEVVSAGERGGALW